MIVIAKKDYKNFIKGHAYEVDALYNDGTSRSYLEGKLEIKSDSLYNKRYSIDGFTLENGDPIPKRKILPQEQHNRYYKFEDLSIGDILVCITNRYKTFTKGVKYRIEELHKGKNPYGNKVKFEGIKLKIKVDPWNFRKLSVSETRDLFLSNIIDDKEIEVVTEKVRGIELVDNKDDTLLKSLFKSALDTNRHHLSVAEWSLRGDKLGIKLEDYDSLMNLTLKEILENKII